ncbi:MAG TPA: hypothetical protein PKA64_00855 [Myxococcota bacterium]|nr:hypothetical protein [Myxococcota bacterium]
MDALEVDPEEVEDLIGAVAFLGRYGGQSIEACERMQPHKLYRYVSAVARLLSEEHSGWRTEDP